MPGSSLWLVPPANHPLHKVLTELISTQLPAKFPGLTGPQFAPHLTLTSNISPTVYGNNPQQWLDFIPWPPASDVRVCFRAVKTEDTFFRRGYIKADFEGVRDVVGIARARGVIGEDVIGPATEDWLREWKSAFGPHVSLIYGCIPLDDTNVADITEIVKEHGISLDSETGAVNGLIGWEGGTIWLVPTDRPIEQWKPIATRVLGS